MMKKKELITYMLILTFSAFILGLGIGMHISGNEAANVLSSVILITTIVAQSVYGKKYRNLLKTLK